MSVDLNQLRRKLKNQSPVGVSRDGQVTAEDPRNDRSDGSRPGNTTLEPKRFW